MTILIFFIVLAILILVHELGHFLAAKKAGIKVEEFGLGFPPRLWGFQKGETLYSINWIPFGGFVKILGETVQTEDSGSINESDKGRTLVDRPRYIQALVLAAGVFFNILLAWGILTFGLWTGMPTSREGVPAGYQLEKTQLIVVDVAKDSPAGQAGLIGGEIITYLSDGENKISNPSTSVVQDFVRTHADKKIQLGYRKSLSGTDTVEKEVSLSPKSSEPGQPAVIGISMNEVGILKLPIFRAIWEGGRLTGLVMWSIVVALWNLIIGIFQGETAVLASVTGPIGLVGVVGSSLSLGFSYLLNLVAVISLNLAVINFLPFPALDGGRILFLTIEGIRRKALSPKLVNGANSVGFFILLGLMALLTYRDIWRMFK